MSNATAVYEPSAPWYEAIVRSFLGAAHCVSGRLPDQWPECPPAQTLVAMAVFVSVVCCCVYGLLSDGRDARPDVTVDVVYTRVDSRWSNADDGRYERYTVRSATPAGGSRFSFRRIIRW